jgi:hypothetical protein
MIQSPASGGSAEFLILEEEKDQEEHGDESIGVEGRLRQDAQSQRQADPDDIRRPESLHSRAKDKIEQADEVKSHHKVVLSAGGLQQPDGQGSHKGNGKPLRSLYAPEQPRNQGRADQRTQHA